MKKNVFILLSFCIAIFSCCDSDDPIKKDPIKDVEKPPVEAEDPFITLKKSNVDFTNEGGSETISIETNISWTANSSDSWCTVSPTRGNKSTESIKVSAAKNESYGDRNTTITIEGEGITKTITVIQSQENAIILSEKTVNISSNNQTLEVELKTNVDFEVILTNGAKDWVSYIGTRALRTEVLLLEISSNENDKARSAEVFIKNKNTNIQDTLTINQESNEPVPGVYWVDKMGTLGVLLNQTQKDTITTMIVKGKINKADFDVMKLDMPNLRYIDLKDVKCEDDKIPDEAFGGSLYENSNKNIATVFLPESITKIGESAFQNCTGLTGNLILPDGITTIEARAFSGCNGLNGSLILPDGLTTIELFAFASCYNLTGSLILPDGLTTIGSAAFASCTRFTGDLIIPDGVRVIKNHTFQGCYGFTGLILPDELYSIENQAFDRCSGFTGDLIIPHGVKNIGAWAFNGCSGFTGDLIIPHGLKTIQWAVFEGCSGFTGDLIISDGVTSIESSAFSGCFGFTALTMGKNVIIINQKAFSNCANITGNVVFPASLIHISKSAFRGCYNVDAFQFPHITPLSYNNDMLERSVPVKVPISAVSAYQSAYGWKQHTIIGYR